MLDFFQSFNIVFVLLSIEKNITQLFICKLLADIREETSVAVMFLPSILKLKQYHQKIDLQWLQAEAYI